MYSGLYGTVFVKKSPVSAPGILYVMLWFANSARTVALCNDILSGGRGGELVPFVHL